MSSPYELTTTSPRFSSTGAGRYPGPNCLLARRIVSSFIRAHKGDATARPVFRYLYISRPVCSIF
jgi:hypothetical protein